MAGNRYHEEINSVLLAIATGGTPLVNARGAALPTCRGFVTRRSMGDANVTALRSSIPAPLLTRIRPSSDMRRPLALQAWTILGGFGGGRQSAKRAGLECALLRARVSPSGTACHVLTSPCHQPSRVLNAPKRSCLFLRHGYRHQRFNAQELAASGVPRATMPPSVRRLFSLGPHYAYGSIFNRIYAFAPSVTGSVDARLGRLRAGASSQARPEAEGASSGPQAASSSHYLIGVHLRLRGQDCPRLAGGSAAGAVDDPCIAPFALAVGELARAARPRRCAVLFASDRRAAAAAFEVVAAQLGCTLVRAERHTATEVGNGADNGDDTGVVALRDIYLLSQSDDLVGSYGSTLTLSAQELLAARYVPGRRIPYVVYCLPQAVRCLPRLPLVMDGASEWWSLSLERWPQAVIRTHADAEGMCAPV